MQDIFNQVLTEIRGAWRFRWWAIIAAWAFCLFAWAVVLFLPDQYEASARFYVNTTTRLDEVMGGVIIDADEETQVALVRQAMLSSPVLERVARDTDLDLRARTPEEREALILGLAKAIDIRSTEARRGSSGGVYLISYRDKQRDKSLEVVAKILDTFKEDVISGRAEGSDETVGFLTQEIDDYRTQLRNLETEIANFKRDNVGLLPGERGGYFEIMQTEMGEARALEAQLSVLRDRRQALQIQLQGERPVLPDGEGASTSGISTPRNDLEARIVELENYVQNLLTRYTEKWPDVIAARDQLEQLYKRRDEELAEIAAAGGNPNILANNPVYQQIQIAMNETNVNIASLEGQLAAKRTEISDLRAKVDVIPQIEARLAELTRDYNQVKVVYGELRERLEQERLRRNRIGWDGVTFEVFDPPRVGLEPVSPNRSRLLITVLIGGLILGAAVAYLMHQMKPVFIDQRELRRITGLPVLGAVSMTWLSRHRWQRRRELGSLALVTVGVVLALALILVFQDFAVDLAADIRRTVLL